MPTLFRDVLLSFDQQPHKPLLEYEIYNLIQKKIPEGYGELSIEEKAELIAFRYLEPNRTKHIRPGFYFQPYSVTPNEDGTVKEFPSVEMVTSDTIAYWKQRLEQCLHPVIVARYAGLIYDLSSHVTNKNASFSIIKKYIEALLNLIDEKLYKVPLYAIDKASRALKVSVAMNNSELIGKCRDTILKLEDEISIPDKPGLWGFSYDLLVDGKKKLVSESEENLIVQKLEGRLKDMQMKDSWCAECAATRLMSFYHHQKSPDEIKRVLQELEISYVNATNGHPTIQKVHYTEQLYQFYKQYQLNEDAETFLIRLRELSKETDRDLKSVSAELNISKEKINNHVDQILTGESSEMIFARIIEAYTPRIGAANHDLDQHARHAPLQFIFPKKLVDKKGRRVATIGPFSEDREGHLFQYLSNTIRIDTLLLHFIFEEAINRGILTTHEIMKFLRMSCIIEKDRFIIIQKATDAYLAGEYMVSIHLLIPQFEEAIRNLVEMNGGNIMVQKNDIFNLKTFDHLLNDEIVTDVFGEDRAIYFRVLFTDNRGWNIRNDVAHGMLDSEHFFNKQNIDRILHAFLCLGMVRYNEA